MSERRYEHADLNADHAELLKQYDALNRKCREAVEESAELRMRYETAVADVGLVTQQLSAIRARHAELLKALRTIEAWPFNIQGDCVADARKLARGAIATAEELIK